MSAVEVLRVSAFVSQSEGEIRALKHMLNFIKLNIKSAKERLKEDKKRLKELKRGVGE